MGEHGNDIIWVKVFFQSLDVGAKWKGQITHEVCPEISMAPQKKRNSRHLLIFDFFGLLLTADCLQNIQIQKPLKKMISTPMSPNRVQRKLEVQILRNNNFFLHKHDNLRGPTPPPPPKKKRKKREAKLDQNHSTIRIWQNFRSNCVEWGNVCRKSSCCWVVDTVRNAPSLSPNTCVGFQLMKQNEFYTPSHHLLYEHIPWFIIFKKRNVSA